MGGKAGGSSGVATNEKYDMGTGAFALAVAVAVVSTVALTTALAVAPL